MDCSHVVGESIEASFETFEVGFGSHIRPDVPEIGLEFLELRRGEV